MSKSNLIYQACNDGTIQIAECSEKYSDVKLQQVFEAAMNKGSWQINVVNQEVGLLVYNINVGSIVFLLYAYLFNVRSSSRGRAKEQRIQLNSNISTTGFNHVHSRTSKCMLMGIYTQEDKIIMCAWDAEKKNNHGKQKSCYIDIETIAVAMRDGFCSKRDNVGHVVVAFKPEFIHYYLMNIAKHHE